MCEEQELKNELLTLLCVYKYGGKDRFKKAIKDMEASLIGVQDINEKLKQRISNMKKQN